MAAPLTTAQQRSLRELPPRTRDDLWNWVYGTTGVKIARRAVWPGNQAPFDAFVAQYPGPLRDRPEGPASLSLTHGSRGSGKSFMASIAGHAASRFFARYDTRILGGSKDQSRQIYDGIDSAVIHGKGPLGSDADSIRKLLSETAVYRNGSRIKILAASSKTTRGPHVPRLFLDEVDELEADLREGAMGMIQEMRGYPPIVSMTSTWHRLAGPMAELIERAQAGAFPYFRFNAFDVLQRCPEDVSGPHVGGRDLYEKCPACPLRPWCHSDLRPSKRTGRPEPMAKRSSGHYSIGSLALKTFGTSGRVFDSDYLCKGPRADGLWFAHFDEAIHVRPDAEFDPRQKVYLAVDTGVRTGAVWFQVHDRDDPRRCRVVVFACYYAEGRTAEENARAILATGESLCQGRRDIAVTDPAGSYRTAPGVVVLGEYRKAGLHLLEWPKWPVADSLSLLEAFVRDAAGRVALHVHPRCKPLIQAMMAYRRAKRNGQWMDYPEDPQHPAEDMVDALRGGLGAAFPNGRQPTYGAVSAGGQGPAMAGMLPRPLAAR